MISLYRRGVEKGVYVVLYWVDVGRCSVNRNKSGCKILCSPIWFLLFVEPKAGLEPATYALRMRCSTNWAISACHKPGAWLGWKCGCKSRIFCANCQIKREVFSIQYWVVWNVKIILNIIGVISSKYGFLFVILHEQKVSLRYVVLVW